MTEPDPVTAAERAVRAAMRISTRHGCAITRQAAEQITDAILALVAEGVTAVTEYGCRYDEEFVQQYRDEAMARKIARCGKSLGHVPVARVVTVGPWQELPGQITTTPPTG